MPSILSMSRCRTVHRLYVRRDHARRDRVAVWVVAAARELGMRPSTLHAALHGRRTAQSILETSVRYAIQHGDHAAAERLVARIEAARLNFSSPLNQQLILRSFVAQSDQTEAAAAFVLNDSPATRLQWRRRLEIDRSTKLEVIQAL